MSKISPPFVSVIIPVYNDPIRLKTCLQALEEQTYPKSSYEVIVVDNGSDESIEPLVAEFCQAKTGYEDRPGSYAARNTGLSLAQGEILAFTDSDCIPAPDWIEKGVKHLLSVPNCGIVGGEVELFFQEPEHPTAVELYDTIMHLNQKMYLKKKNFSATANLFTFKRVFDHVGYFDAALKSGGDQEWGRRVASSGYQLVYAADALVNHPARHSFEQLRRKTERITKGAIQWKRKYRKPLWQRLHKELLISFLPPVLTLMRLEKDQNVHAKEKINVILIWFAMQFITITTRVREKFKRT